MSDKVLPSYITNTIASIGALGAAYYGYHVRLKYKEAKLPEEWKQIGILKSIYIYPFKSCGAIQLDEAECTSIGLRKGWIRDRFFMIINEKNNFLTARAYPDLLMVQLSVQDTRFTLKYKDLEELNVDLEEVLASKVLMNAKIWGVQVPVYDCGWESSEWFSRLLDKSTNNFKLVYYASECSRPVQGSINNFKATKNDTGALPDEAPFHLVNEATVNEFNKHLEDCQVSYRNFRPNFVVSEAIANIEDNWQYVKIGENIFEIVKPCTRCIMTTVDPEYGTRNARTEPLKTLRRYCELVHPNKKRNDPRMGVQIALCSGPGGRVSSNDPIYVPAQ